MRRLSILLVSALIVLLAGLTTAWLLRFRVADELVRQRLTTAGVPAAYRITRLDPFVQRIEGVRIGDAASPDLLARRVDVLVGYAASGPYVRGIRAEHVRLRGRADRRGLTFGTLDPLLPRASGGGASLPDLDLALVDTRLALATPGGRLTMRLDGSGNPRRLFRGRIGLVAPTMRAASCLVTDVGADLSVTVRSAEPGVAGRVSASGAICPSIRLGRGAMRLAVRSDAALERFAGRATLDGFGGTAGPLRFARVTGGLRGGGRRDGLALDTRLSLASMSAPVAAREVAAASIPQGTPLPPTMARGRAAIVALLAEADARVTAGLRMQAGKVSVDVRQLSLRGSDGGHVSAIARGGMSWSDRGSRLDANLSGGGGAIPRFDVRLRQAAAGAPLDGTARLDPYRADRAVLAIPAARFAWSGERLAVDGRFRLDGPLGDGEVRGLEVPVRGWVAATGAFAVGQGCGTVTAAAATLAAVTFSQLRLPFCGDPLVARAANGPVRIDGATGPLLLRGRTSDGAPATIGVASVRLSERGFALRGLTAEFGGPTSPTRLLADGLAGSFTAGGASGSFTGTTARIGAVPLALTGGAGRWRLDAGALRLSGRLRIGDTAASPRFNPLVAEDATLALRDGRVTAAAVLREPSGRATVATVELGHDLSRGSGEALLVIDGLRFVPKGLQPEKLTPLTLGVIANVSGTVSGRGRIDWDARGVTSSGSFATERLDFAAAFGPVTDLRGSIAFSDLLNLVSAPDQRVTIAEINPGLAIANGVVRFHLPGGNRVAVDDARWPFAGGTLRLDPATVDLAADLERRLTFRLEALDAGAFVQQLDLPNVSATGTFDGVLPMVFGQAGGRIDGGSIAARPPGGTIAYVGELSRARLGAMGKLAFDALKAIRYSTLTIGLDGQLDGEMVSRVRFTGVREATPDRSLAARLLRGLPFRFNIDVRAPFRGLLGTARTYADPQLLLRQPAPAVQPPASGGVR